MERNYIYSGFSKNLRTLMGEKEIGINELVGKSGISKSTIIRYLNGKTVPDIVALDALADALGVSRFMLIIFN